MKNIHLLPLLCFIFFVSMAEAEQESLSISNGIGLVQDLSLKLAALGSFQAEYRGVAPDKSADITLLFNKERSYCLCKISVAEADQQEDVYTVLDFSKMNGKRGAFSMLLISGGEGNRFTVSFQDMFESLDNPIGVLFFMAKHFGLETQTDADQIDVEPGAPLVSLGLSEESLVFGMGIASKSKHLTASWLDEDAITNAVKIFKSPESIQFSYKENHIVVIEKKTGLLLKDIWPNPARPESRYIALKSHSALKRNVPYSLLIPLFDSIAIQELPPEHLYKQMYVSFLTDLGRKLSEIDGFEEKLGLHSADIAAAIRKFGRAMIRDDAKKRVNNDKTKEFTKEFLRPAYEQYRVKHAQKAGDVSFLNFLSNLMREAEANPSTLMSPSSRNFTETIKKECEKVLADLPEDAQQPLRKLFDDNMSALAEGWILEFLAATLDQVKTLELKEDKDTPNQEIHGTQ